jgi:hypothetical protein
MSAYKQLNSQDLIVSPFEVNKSFHFEGKDALTSSIVEINRYLGVSGDYLTSSSLESSQIPGQELSQILVYDSIQQLYYQNYISSSDGFIQSAVTASVLLGANVEGNTFFGKTQSTNFYDYPQTSLWPSKTFPTPSIDTASVEIGVISIPSKLFGDFIQPESFLLEGPTGSIKDDGEGRLLFQGTSSGATFSYMAGNIIYEHGIVTIFDSKLPGALPGGGSDQDFYGTAIYGTSLYGAASATLPPTDSFITDWITGSLVTMSFSSSYTLYETQYKATISENEFNYTLNPSSVSGSTIPTYFSGSSIDWPNSGSSGVPINNITGSYFSPYITTIGLYDENFELLAIGKLAQPLQSSQVTDTTILVNLDR